MWKYIGVVPKGGTPCKDCEKKGCGSYHDQCPEYKEYRERVDEIRRRHWADSEKMAKSIRNENPKTLPNSITRTHKHR